MLGSITDSRTHQEASSELDVPQG